MIAFWTYTVALGASITVSTVPTQVLAATQFFLSGKGLSSRKARAALYNDDATNTVTFTLYQSGDSTRQNATPQVVVVGPQSVDRIQIDDVVDEYIWISATSSAGTCVTRCAVLVRNNT